MAGISTAPPPPARRGISFEDLKHIDITHLSQSELQSLSLTSDSAFDLNRTDDVVSPHLDRSVFNESAGSRRQTYSRIHHRSHSRLPGLHPSFKSPRHPDPSSDPVSHSILHFLKHFLDGNHNPPAPPQLPEPPKAAAVIQETGLGFLGLGEKLKIKGKRGRKIKNLRKEKILGSGVGVEVEKVNGKGEVVDFGDLERKGDEVYGEELRRRTVGLETEEGVLGFLRGLEGQWCSRRKKRKYVDAGVLGDALPVGWKVLLGLRRRDYRVSVYCRRFISPTGQQFLSCKEAASFLKSYFGANGADQQRDQKTCSIQQAYILSSEKNAQPTDKGEGMAHDIVAHSTVARNSSKPCENDDSLMDIENLPEVQVCDIFECVKCNLTFDEKNLYLQHLFSFHQKTTKRYKFGAPVGEGVIIKDGKYECQFCHKVFQERRSYNGHVGVHVRTSVKNSTELAIPVDVDKNVESLLQEAVPSTSSKMDVLIEIAENPIAKTSTARTGEQITDQSDRVLRLEGQAASSNHEGNLSSDPVGNQAEDFAADRPLGGDLNHGNQVMMEDNETVINDCTWNVSIKIDAGGINDSEPARSSEIQNYENSSLEAVVNGNRCLKPSDGHLGDTPGLTVEEIVFQDADTSAPLAQSFTFFPPFDKGEHDFTVTGQKLENVTGFEELGFDDMDPFRYGFANGQELASLPGGSMHLGNENVIEDGFNSSVRFGSEVLMLNTLDANQLTVCVWCRTEFTLEGIESEAPSDTIGYMCPTCKAKISGHFTSALFDGSS